MPLPSLPPLGARRPFHRGALPAPPTSALRRPVPLPARCGLPRPDSAGSQRGRGGRAAQEQISRCHTHSGSGAAQCAVGRGCPAPGGTPGRRSGHPAPQPSLPSNLGVRAPAAGEAGRLVGCAPPAGLGPPARHRRPPLRDGRRLPAQLRPRPPRAPTAPRPRPAPGPYANKRAPQPIAGRAGPVLPRRSQWERGGRGRHAHRRAAPRGRGRRVPFRTSASGRGRHLPGGAWAPRHLLAAAPPPARPPARPSRWCDPRPRSPPAAQGPAPPRAPAGLRARSRGRGGASASGHTSGPRRPRPSRRPGWRDRAGVDSGSARFARKSLDPSGGTARSPERGPRVRAACPLAASRPGHWEE